MQPKRRQRQRNYEDNEEDNVNDNGNDKGNDNDKDKDKVLDTCLANRGATQKKGPDTKTYQCVCVSRSRKYSLSKVKKMYLKPTKVFYVLKEKLSSSSLFKQALNI